MKKYALLYWDTKTQSMKKWSKTTDNYVSEKEFIDDDWQEKAFDLDMNDYIEIKEN